jgi:cell division protein FtsB|tara:strand:- start:1475 stop:1804 length:330 start_codon:yes stop_codon:yes gene_type:complete
VTKSILRRLGYFSIIAVSLFSLMLLGVIPVQELFEVRDTKDELLVELAKVEELNKSYRVSIDALNTDEEIERIARSEYNLVKPHEEAYYVVPLSAEDVKIPGIWPFNKS